MKRLILFFAFTAAVLAADSPVDFAREVRPLLERHCFKCHGPEKQKGGLRLDNKTDAFRPGDSKEPAIVSHSPDKSLLLMLLKSADLDERMPQKADALPAADIALLERWVREGANWPDEKTRVASGKRELTVTAGDRAHWAYRPIAKVKPPAVRDAAWVRTPVDNFILAKLEAAGIKPAPEASAQALSRRLSFALTGLPPAADEEFKIGNWKLEIEKLLASRAYGERWARLWLDVVRYADSEGYEKDADRPNSWRYRDFVIHAFNDDLPFDRFVHWQIAGDELAPDEADALVATGFLALGPHAETQPTDTLENREKVRYDNLDDVVSTTGSALLAVTVGCARCHDHKYDAIPTRDYYSLLGAFAGGERADFQVSRAHRERERWLGRERVAWREAKMAELNVPEEDRELLRHPLNPNNPTLNATYKTWGDKLKVSDDELRAGLGDERRRELAPLDERCAAETQDAKARALAWLDADAAPAPNWLLTRGDPMRKAEEIQPGFLQVLNRSRPPAEFVAAARKEAIQRSLRSTGRRAALAAWLTDTKDGAGALLARVIVNRIWQAHFGEGLVRTPNDFGVQGEQPTHPELLDWLAGELIRSGWRLKHIQRLIVNSTAWRMGSADTPRVVAGAYAGDWSATSPKTDGVSGGTRALPDPDNRLFSHRRPLRLAADALRDSLLAVSGALRESDGGPGFKPAIPAEAMASRTADKYPDKVADGPEVWRRSIYTFMKRSMRFPFAEVFDAPDPTTSCGRRLNTTVPTQQLALLNDEFVRARAKDFAARLEREAPDSDMRIRRGFQLALAREPSTTELAASHDFLSRGSLTDWCHALFTLNEFAYVD